MVRKYLVAVAAFAGAVCAPIQAHHSFAAEYDANQPLVIKGAVNHVDWVNPHSWVYVDVTGADGKVVGAREVEVCADAQVLVGLAVTARE